MVNPRTSTKTIKKIGNSGEENGAVEGTSGTCIDELKIQF